MPLPGRAVPARLGLMRGSCWSATDDARYRPLVHSFTSLLTTSSSIRMTPSMSTANRRHSWRSARLVASSSIPFGTWRITLAEAVAKAGGLNDGAADPASVFLYRGETREVAEAMGIDCSKFQGPIIPVIYNINFRNPGSYFLATTFEMRNKDVIQVSNSVSTEATKFLTYIRTVNSTLNDPINYAINAYTLRGILQGTSNVSTAIFTGSTSHHSSTRTITA